MKFKFAKWTVVPVIAMMVGSIAVAQDPSSGSTTNQSTTAPKPDPAIQQRKENQQDRIANGVEKGQLTAGETAKLETKEAAVNKEIKTDRAANGGKLTPQERRQVNRQQNQLSHQIYRDKHNANTAHYGNNEVGKRRENQQDRIAEGVKNGQLTAGETAKLENQQRNINQQVAADRRANGGKLTPGEKAQINHEQNQASRNIHKKKHNARTQPGVASKK